MTSQKVRSIRLSDQISFILCRCRTALLVIPCSCAPVFVHFVCFDIVTFHVFGCVIKSGLQFDEAAIHCLGSCVGCIQGHLVNKGEWVLSVFLVKRLAELTLVSGCHKRWDHKMLLLFEAAALPSYSSPQSIVACNVRAAFFCIVTEAPHNWNAFR